MLYVLCKNVTSIIVLYQDPKESSESNQVLYPRQLFIQHTVIQQLFIRLSVQALDPIYAQVESSRLVQGTVRRGGNLKLQEFTSNHRQYS